MRKFLFPFFGAILLLSSTTFCLPATASPYTIIRSASPPRTPKAYVEPADFRPLLSHKWKGSLSIVNPADGKKQEIPTTLTVSVDSSNILNWTFLFSFAEGRPDFLLPVRLSRNGHKLNKEKLTSRSKSKIGTLQLVTLQTIKGMRHRNTYFLNFDTFGLQHEEKGAEEKDFSVRHTYLLHRE